MTCSTSRARWRARSSAAGPRLVGNQKILEWQDQHAAERDRARGPQQGQPAADGLQQRSTGRAGPTCRSGRPRAAAARRWRRDMSRSSPGSGVPALMPSPPAAAPLGRGSPVRQSGAPVLVSLHPAPRSNRISLLPGAGCGLAIVWVEHRQRGRICCSVSRCCRPLVPCHRLPHAADLSPTVEQPFRPGQACCEICSPAAPASRLSRSITSSQRLARRCCASLASFIARSATLEHGRGIGGQPCRFRRRPLPKRKDRSVRSRSA